MAIPTPKFFDFFKSCYYSNTYISPVDLGTKKLQKDLFSTDNPGEAAIAQELISIPDVQEVLSNPLSYVPTQIEINNKKLTDHNFKLLSSKPILSTPPSKIPFYSVIEHDRLPGYVIKSGAARVPKDMFLVGPGNDLNEMARFNEEDSLLRIAMRNRIEKVAKKYNIEVVLPRKKLVSYADTTGATDPTQKYCTVCEKLDIPSVDDTVAAITRMDEDAQKALAQKISLLIQKVGFVDTSFDNIRLNPENKIVIVDTEPAGLMVKRERTFWKRIKARLFSSRPASVEKCARVGLFTLKNLAPLASPFREEIQKDYIKVSKPKLSKWKIGLSIAIPLIPAINIIRSLINTWLTKRTLKKMQKLDAKMMEFQLQAANVQGRTLAEAQDGIAKESIKYQSKRLPWTRKFFAGIEGVPYRA